MRPSLDPVALRRVVERQESSRVVLDLIISGPRRSGSKFGTSHAAAAECSLASLLDLGRRHTTPDLTVPGSACSQVYAHHHSCVSPLSVLFTNDLGVLATCSCGIQLEKQLETSIHAALALGGGQGRYQRFCCYGHQATLACVLSLQSSCRGTPHAPPRRSDSDSAPASASIT